MRKIVIGSITIGTIIAIITIGVLLNLNEKTNEESIKIEDTMSKEIMVDENAPIKIQEKLNEIRKDSLENTYTPRDREWITSGPFQIDRSEYNLGEKIFLKINEIKTNEKGQVVFFRPLNDTHHSVYVTVPFDGMKKSGFNYYIQPSLLKSKNTCSVEDILGKWIVDFRGTQYKELNFVIINQTIPGDETKFYNPVC